jgi:hypothetical protein
MAKSFRDIAQDLRTKPGLRLPNGKFLDRLFIVQVTEPSSAYGACINSTAKAVTKAIAIAAPATVVSDGDYSFGITGSWGSTFVVRVGGTSQSTAARLCLPTGSTQSQFLSRLYERLANEYSVCPSFTAGGALAVFDTAGIEIVATVPGGFLSLATGTANFVTPQADDKYRIGAPHPDCEFLKLSQIESSGRDDHNVNLTLFYKVDQDLLAASLGVSADSLRSRIGYEITEPHDSPVYPRVQWAFEVVNIDAYNRPANGTAHPWVAGCILTNESRTEQQGAVYITRIYEPIPGPWIWTTTDDGSEDLLSAWKRILLASPGDAATPPADYQKTTSKLDPDASIYTATYSFTFAKVPGPPQTAWSFDEATGLLLPTRTTTIAASTVPAFSPSSPTVGTAIDAQGVSTEYRPQSRYLATKIESLQIPPKTGSPLASRSREWWTTANYYWPPVLLYYDITTIEQRSGAEEYRVFVNLRDGVNGPSKAKITEIWHAENPYPGGTGILIEQMRPTGFQFQGARLRFNLPECLHGTIDQMEFIGNTDPVYVTQGYRLYVPATNFTEWPASIVADHDIRPWRGGFMERITTVYPPDDVEGYTPPPED